MSAITSEVRAGSPSRALLLLIACVGVLGVSACGVFSDSDPDSEGQGSDSAWYNTSGLKELFGDYDPANPLYVTNPARIAQLKSRGAYLTKNVAACGACHGAKAGDPQSELSGGRLMRDSFGQVRAANITPDRETGIGKWNVGAVMRAMRASLDIDGKPLSIDLHRSFRWMSDEDAAAIAVFVLSGTPVQNKVERRELGGFERNEWGLFPQHRDIAGYVPELKADIPIPYGRYLAHHVAQCSACHTAGGGIFTSAVPFAGRDGEVSKIETPVGLLISLYDSFSRSEVEGAEKAMPYLSKKGREELRRRMPGEDEMTSNQPSGVDAVLEAGEFPLIGPDIRGESPTGLAEWSEDDIVRFLSSGEVPGGGRRDGRLCPWPFFNGMRTKDKQAIAEFLKTL